MGIVECSLGGSFDVRISRLISLWFDNRANEQLTLLLDKWLPKIPSCHWIAVLPQLAARLTLPAAKSQLFHPHFPALLLNLMEQCARQHPHHTLSVLLALVLTNKDKEYAAPTTTTTTTTKGTRSVVDAHSEEDRVVVSKKLLAKLKKTPGPLGSLCRKMELLNCQLIKLANQPTSTEEGKTLPKNLTVPPELAELKDCQDVAVPTVSLGVRSDGVYDRELVGIVRFESTFELVGGVNAPKKLTCLCTDGVKRPMLLKGKVLLSLIHSFIKIEIINELKCK